MNIKKMTREELEKQVKLYKNYIKYLRETGVIKSLQK